MNWVKKQKLPAIEAIQFNGQLYIKLEDLWDILYSSFNSTQSHDADLQLLDKIPNIVAKVWTSFSRELINAIEICNNLSAPGLNKLTWSHIKRIIKNKECITKFIDIANAYIDLCHWPSHFKTSTTVIISKPNKIVYNSSKFFHPIVLSNTMGKLFKKIIGEQLQFLMISNNFIHPCQLGSFKQRSTTDVGITLTYFIQLEWVKNLSISMLAFDISQFFPSLNHQLLPLITDKSRTQLQSFNLLQELLSWKKNQISVEQFSISLL